MFLKQRLLNCRTSQSNVVRFASSVTFPRYEHSGYWSLPKPVRILREAARVPSITGLYSEMSVCPLLYSWYEPFRPSCCLRRFPSSTLFVVSSSTYFDSCLWYVSPTLDFLIFKWKLQIVFRLSPASFGTVLYDDCNSHCLLMFVQCWAPSWGHTAGPAHA